MNKVILIGHVTRDPELRQTTNGHGIATFSIATNRTWLTSDNKKHESTEFHDLVAWGKLAEICSKYVGKGTAVYVEGRLHTRKWEAPDGTKRHKTEVVINELNILTRKKSLDDNGDEKQMDSEFSQISPADDSDDDMLDSLDLDSEDLPANK